MALASGAKTDKMKYGNRGQNIPCTSMITGKCYITSQNHGYAVDATSLPDTFKELFVNANDDSNEGIYHVELPYYSVQFHPEACPGPRDTEFLFDVFIESMEDCDKAGKLVPISAFQKAESVKPFYKLPSIRKVLILGSGGLSIGQAGEFDYSGSQAIKALKGEGIYTILINPNIATIQTSTGLADKVYFLPVTPEFVRKVIEHEHPDGVYVTFGGQTALNVGVAMKEEFENAGVRVLGTPIETIVLTEDRDLFAKKMAEIGEKCAKSKACTSTDEAVQAALDIGYPVIVRAAFALGGLGSGFADNEQELSTLCKKAFAASPQVLIEKSMKGWKEIEYEVVRDCADNCITVCNMENFDPLGIHTGDSIVVAPSQTLSDEDYNMLRTTAVNVIKHLGVIGECNIQYALNPHSKEYCIIEVNARLSRSSALASKATGYPLAFVAAKLGLGIPLNQIKNSVTKKTSACFEPSLDYVVVKIPRWDLKKFSRVSTNLSSSMKSVGEVMAIGRTFEETIQKAIRAVDESFIGFSANGFCKDIDHELVHPSHERLFAIAKAFQQNYTIDRIHELSKIDKWFLSKLLNIHNMEQRLLGKTLVDLKVEELLAAKQQGFSDKQIAFITESNEIAVRKFRTDKRFYPFVKQIDTVAAEFPAYTNYLYTTYNASENDVSFNDNGVIVVGSGVYRIGSSVEFDWCAVSAVRTLRKNGIKTVMINYNPETVSTDYDEADRLYFENINLERVLDIYQLENSSGVMLSMGGQTANNIALPMYRQGVKILGTNPEMIDSAENRFKFSRLLDKIDVSQPQWKELTSIGEAEAFCSRVGYPVLVRPSYVLSGAAMNVVYSSEDLESYLKQAVDVSPDFPVVITKFIENAKEIEVDAVAHEGKVVAYMISEHVENAGVHSGDATIVFPPQDLDAKTVSKILEATEKISESLNVTGPFNIQFIAKDQAIRVIECNLRASRSFPFVSKVSSLDMIELATKVMFGLEYQQPTNWMPKDFVGVKVPQFSFSRLQGADPILGVEMASTGEVACFGKTKHEAYLKALLSTGFILPKKNILISIGSYREKLEFLPYVEKLVKLGFSVFATPGTSDFMQEHELPVKYLGTFDGEHDEAKMDYSLSQHLANNLIDLYINLPSRNHFRRPASYMSQGYKSRRMAIDFSIPLITNIKCAKMFVEALVFNFSLDISSIDSKKSRRSTTIPGLIALQTFIPEIDTHKEIRSITQDLLSGGFTTSYVMPITSKSTITTKDRLDGLRQICAEESHSRFTLSVLSASSEVSVEDIQNYRLPALYIPFDKVYADRVSGVAQVEELFRELPKSVMVVTDAKGVDLASVLLMASLYSKQVHVTGVCTKEDLHLLDLSKRRGLKVTCDVNVLSLYISKEMYPEAGDLLGSKNDIQELWKLLDCIDCFSIGPLSHRISVLCPNLTLTPGDSLALLLSSVAQDKLDLPTIITKLLEKPKSIFGIPVFHGKDVIELEMDYLKSIRDLEENREAAVKYIRENVIHRAILNGKTKYLDGRIFETSGNVLDISHEIGRKKSRVSYAETNSAGTRRSRTSSFTEAPTEAEAVNNAVLRQPVSKVSLLETVGKSSPFAKKHILTVDQFTRSELHLLFGLAQEMGINLERKRQLETLKGRVLCNMFYEPSTRTSCSFETAMLRLGGTVTSVEASKSSTAKGETLADTIRTLACYADAIVLRHPDAGSAQVAGQYSSIPIINAGDGVGEHPTQAFLDAYTIREELGTLNGLSITLVGDLRNGRTVHSLVKVLCLYQVKLNYVSAPSLRMPDHIKNKVKERGIQQTEYDNILDVIASTDVLYVTRVQKERFSTEEEYESVKNSYVVDNRIMAHAKDNMIVMHPLPRVNEVKEEVDFDLRAAYFRQMRYGLHVRMALLALVLS